LIVTAIEKPTSSTPHDRALPHLTYTRSQRAWTGLFDDGTELVVPGNKVEPASGHLDFANEVVAHLDAAVTAAAAYVGTFVVPDRLDGGVWTLLAVTVGRAGYRQDLRTFELAMANTDDRHGRWTVGFAPAQRPQRFPHVPCWFGRQQI